MTRRSLGLLLLILLICAGLENNVGPTQTVYAADEPPRIWLASPVKHEARFRGESLDQAAPLSLAAGNFDGDGVGDLAAGYATPGGGRIAIFRGSLDAFAPQSQASFEAISRQQFSSPYLPDVKVFSVPNRPDFLAADDFIGNDCCGLVAAARGGSNRSMCPVRLLGWPRMRCSRGNTRKSWWVYAEKVVHGC
jgi:hypothetical protein